MSERSHSPRSRRGNEADFLDSPRNRPPRYLGGYHFSDTLLSMAPGPRMANGSGSGKDPTPITPNPLSDGGVGVSPHFFRQHRLEKNAGLTPTPTYAPSCAPATTLNQHSSGRDRCVDGNQARKRKSSADPAIDAAPHGRRQMTPLRHGYANYWES